MKLPQVKVPLWLAEAIKNKAALAVAAAIVTALSVTALMTNGPSQVSVGGDQQGKASATDEQVAAAADAQAQETAGTTTQQAAAKDQFRDNPLSDTAYAQKIGANIEPQSTSLPNGNPNTWVGVTKDTIKAVFSYDASNCGVNVINAISQTSAQLPSANRFYRKSPTDQEVANKETRESVDILVRVFNKRAFETAELYPKIRPLMGDDPEHPFYGRKLIHEFIDGGSFQCPEKTTAAAIDIIEQRKAFLVFNNFDGTAHNMADALNAKAAPAKRPMHAGTLWLSDDDYSRWSPFNWTQFNSGTRAMELYSSWLCSRVVGKNAVNADDFASQKRKFGLLYPDLAPARKVAGELKAFLQKDCGTDIIQGREFAYEPDPSRAADEGTTIGVRFKVDGVTSVIYVHDPLFPIFQLPSWESQDYQPEMVFTPTGYFDSSTVTRIYASLTGDHINKRAFGISQFGIPGGFFYEAGDPFWVYHDEHKVSPNSKKPCDPSSDAGMSHDEQYCKAPGGIVTWYYTALDMLAGIIFAGPDLNPTNATKGLQGYPGVRYGLAGPTDDPRPALLGPGPGKHYFIKDAIEWRFRAWFVSPPPESKLGWIDYPDCQRHYNRWPNELSIGWEKDGPHYNAWCGDAKFAPPDPPTTSGGGGPPCDGAPGDKCERDNYPRWGPEHCWQKGTC